VVKDGIPQFRDDAWAVNDFPTAEDRAIADSGKMFEKVKREKKVIYTAPGPSGDYDNDGRIDLFLPNWWPERRSMLLRNETKGGNWLQVEVKGAKGVNRQGVGSRVNVYEAGKLGLDAMDAGAAQALCERVFADTLGGVSLIANKSIWRQFPKVWNRRWSVGNRVLLGDALHTAHFSIGSGTRLAMEDVIALVKGLDSAPGDLRAGLARYEATRKPILEKLVTAAAASANWHEHFPDHMALPPRTFAMSYMTRSGRIDAERLREMAPKFMAFYEGR
jgi:hypothetical protein